MTRPVGIAVLLLLMAGFGFGVYHALDLQKSIRRGVQPPTQVSAVPLPGTIYLAQAGALYRLRGGTFTRIAAADGWTQPSVVPEGNRILAVRRTLNNSDIYVLDSAGKVQQQVTHDDSSVVERNHWAFYPRLGPDGQTIFYTYDPKDPHNNYRVDLSIFALAPGARAPGRQWTYPNEYTGGDVVPVPLRTGALIYTKHSIDASGKAHSQVWIQARAGSPGLGLTAPEDDCGQPAVSPDGQLLAMVCRHGQATADIEVATLDAANYAITGSTVAVPAGLNASPAFSPDGRQLAYFAPGQGGPGFQLWTAPVPAAKLPAPPAGSPSPTARPAAGPRQITRNLGLDTTGPPAWA